MYLFCFLEDLIECDFESPCDWGNVNIEDTMDWRLHSGRTKTPNTGPYYSKK